MEKPNDQPEDKSPRKPLTQKELDALLELTNGRVEEVDEEYRSHMENRIFECTDIDRDHLHHLTVDQLDFIYDGLGLEKTKGGMPDFNTRLANTNRLKELLGKMERDEI